MHKLSIYVPSTRNTDQVTDNAKYVAIIAKTLSSLYGGCSVSKIDGYYVAENGTLIAECIDCVYTFANDAEKLAKTGNYIARWLKRVMRQESVLVTIERMEIVNFV